MTLDGRSASAMIFQSSQKSNIQIGTMIMNIENIEFICTREPFKSSLGNCYGILLNTFLL